jgi:hypothetical protein
MKTFKIDSPSFVVSAPDGWELDQTADAWAVVRTSPVDGFIPNVAVVPTRVQSDVPLDKLAAATLEGLVERYDDVVVREVRTSNGAVDRSVSFTTEGKSLVQYQRMVLVRSTSTRVHWFVQIQATTLLSHEATYRESFGSILSSFDVIGSAIAQDTSK